MNSARIHHNLGGSVDYTQGGILRNHSNGSGNSMGGSSFYSYIPLGQSSGYSMSFPQGVPPPGVGHI